MSKIRVAWLCDKHSPHIKRWKKVIEKHDIEIILISLPKLRPRYRYAFAITYITLHVHSVKPDIVHAHFASSYGVISTFVKYACPKVTSIWGSDLLIAPAQGVLYNLFLKRSLSKPDKLIVNSEFLKQQANALVAREYTHIPFGIDFSEFPEVPRKKLSASKVRLGIVKRLHTVAGVDLAIRALQILRNNYSARDYTLTIVGDGPEKGKLGTLAKDLGLELQVDMLGDLPPLEVAKVYQGLDIALFPSRVEGLGVSVIEAMKSGVPVVAHNIQGIQELLAGGQHGTTIDINTPDEIAKRVSHAVENYSNSEMLAHRAHKFVVDKYDISSNAKSLKNLYQGLLMNETC